MSPPLVTQGRATPSDEAGKDVKPRVIAAAEVNEVMREQLELLIEHARGGTCGCAECDRYLRARNLLLEAFRTAPSK